MRRQVALAALFVCVTASANAALKISVAPTNNVNCAGGICTATAKNAVLNISDLLAILTYGDATVVSGVAAKDIEIDATLSWANTSRLTLDSYHAIDFDKAVHVLAAGALTIQTNDGGTDGDFRFFGPGRVEFRDTAASLTINGQSYALAKGMKQIVALRAQQGPSYIALAGSLDLARKAYGAAPIPSMLGTLEGLGNTISNLRVSDSTSDCVALIGCEGASDGPTLRDIGLLSVDIQGSGSHQSIGALIGTSINAAIVGSYATGHVSSTGDRSWVGGLVGVAIPALIERSSSAVAVAGSGAQAVAGGLAGQVFAICNSGCQGAVDQSFATGEVSVSSDAAWVGGLVGFNVGGTITNSYATGAVTSGHDAYAGGLIGWNWSNPGESATSTLIDSYSLGSVIADPSNYPVGGVIGYDGDGNFPTVNVQEYWDLDTSGITNPTQGAGYPANDTGLTGLSDAQFKSALPAGFDKKIWKQAADINNCYPYLIHNPPR